jgi:hypothetical protein
MPWIFSDCGSHTFILIHSRCTSHILTFGTFKKLDQRKKGVRTKFVTNCPKEIGNPITCQGPHNPSIVCQSLEHDCNQWRTILTLWPFEDWKHFLVWIDALVFCQTMGCKARSHDLKCCLEMGHNKQFLGVAIWAITRIRLGMRVLCYKVHNQLLQMEIFKLVS